MYSKQIQKAEKQRQIEQLKLRQNQLKILLSEEQGSLIAQKRLKLTRIATQLNNKEISATQAKLEAEEVEAEYEAEKLKLQTEYEQNAMQLNIMGESAISQTASIVGNIALLGGGIASATTGSKV